MILSDRDIRAAMQRPDNALIIDPPVNDEQMQPASVEMNLGSTLAHRSGKQIDLGKWGHGYPMRPREFLLGHTIQRVRVPDDLVAVVNGKSSIGRLGLTVHVTAGFVDPGFDGEVTLELANLSNESVTLHAGMIICQLVFHQMTSPAERPYGSAGLGSHYQGQRGPTPSQLQVGALRPGHSP